MATEKIEDLLNQPSVKFAGRMKEAWRTLQTTFGKDERYWKLYDNDKLRQMQEQVSRLIAECEKELEERPSPPGLNSIADNWQNDLTFVNKRIAELIADKS